MFPQIPFAPGTDKVDYTPYSADIGKKFIDKDGSVYKLYKLSQTAVGSTFAAGDTLVLDADRDEATDDVSAGLDATYPAAAGVVCGSTGVTKSTTSTTYCDLLLIKGRKKIRSSGTVNQGDGLITSASVDGAPVALDKTTAIGSETAKNHFILGGKVGVAAAAASSNLVWADVDIFG